MMKALLSRPLLLLPTVWATIESILFSELNFREAHGGRGPANAFRHAAWNLLIAKNCMVFTSADKALEWAEFITNMHEECFPNDEFDNQMDLHNNEVGRQVFYELIQKNITTKPKMIEHLVQLSKEAVGCVSPSEIAQFPLQLVYYKNYTK